ncbi:MAG: transcription antitermination factor NusB [Magnetococcales bacterium]|nr:transcription antitermination factor NusB [Magnetococcales bacterium]
MNSLSRPMPSRRAQASSAGAEMDAAHDPGTPPLRSRHKARELALLAMYQCDISGDGMQRAVGQLCEDNADGRADLDYFQKVASGAWSRLEELDRWIAVGAKNWSLARISTIDRNILRQGIYELLAEPDLPVPVVIHEAIELSKRYGGDGSGSFVNGVMDNVAGQIRGTRRSATGGAE